MPQPEGTQRPVRAIRSFARGWIVDLKGRDIRINVLSPGHTETPGLSTLADQNVRDMMKANVPLGRMGSVDDIGQTAVFLASPLASYISGCVVVCDGGANLGGSARFNAGAEALLQKMEAGSAR